MTDYPGRTQTRGPASRPRRRSIRVAVHGALVLALPCTLAVTLEPVALEGRPPSPEVPAFEPAGWVPWTVPAQDTAEQSGDQSVVQDTATADPPEPVSDLRAEQDEQIRTQLQAVFDRVPALARVEVTVDAGVVRLEGTVLDSEARTRAAELADRLEGVLFVDNRVEESTSLHEQLQPTWSRLRAVGYGTVAKLPLLVVSLLIVGFASALGAFLSRWRGPAFLHVRNPFLQGLIRRFVQGGLVLGAILLALDLLDATKLVGAVVGTAGLAGLAVGFAFKDIVENYLAGVILAFRQPFAKNDHLRVEGYEGKVVRLTPRETILMTLEGNHIRLPNALIFRSPMINFTRNPLRRFQFDAGVGTGDDLAGAREVAIATLRGMEGVLDDPPPEALVMGLGASTVDMRFMAWVDQRDADFGRVRSEAIRLVKSRLEEAGYSMPSPEYLVRMQGGEGEPAPPGAERPGAVVQADVSVDTTVDEQIEADRRRSGEEDLLDGSGAQG